MSSDSPEDMADVVDVVDALLAWVSDWQFNHPRTADYRITDAEDGLRQTRKALDHMMRGEHYPEWYAARDAYIRRRGESA